MICEDFNEGIKHLSYYSTLTFSAKHLQDLLMESVNFSPASLSSTGSRYLTALVDSAVALETKDTSLAR